MGASNTKSSNAQPSEPIHAPLPAFKHAVVLQGLPNSGKSTVQARLQIPSTRVLQIDDRFLTKPTIFEASGRGWHGNNPIWQAQGDLDDTIWSQGGRGSIHAVWSIVVNSTKALVFVVDASDRATLAPGPDSPAPLPDSFAQGYLRKSKQEQAEVLDTLRSRMTAKQLLASLFATGEMKNRPLLVLANKQDQPGAMPPAELAELLGLPAIDDIDWRISGCNAQTGEGLDEAFQWLNYAIACPSDFTKVREKKQLAEQLADQKKWAAQREQRKVDDARAAERDRALARGHVLPAPEAPWRSNGTRWAASAEQLEQFVLAPLTIEPALIVAREVIEAIVANVELISANANPAPQFNVPTPAETNDAVAESADVVAAVAVEPAAVPAVVAKSPAEQSRSGSNSDAAARSPEVSFLARTESSVHSRSAAGDGESEVVNETLGAAQQQQQPSNEAPDSNPDASNARATTTKSFNAASFASLSSSFLVLPPSSAIPTTEMRMMRKHWYSKKHMRPVPEKDIHKIHRFSWI